MAKSTNLLNVEFIYTLVANYAIQQNRIPIVRKLVIENTSNDDLLDLRIEIKSEPGFINNWVSSFRDNTK